MTKEQETIVRSKLNDVWITRINELTRSIEGLPPRVSHQVIDTLVEIIDKVGIPKGGFLMPSSFSSGAYVDWNNGYIAIEEDGSFTAGFFKGPDKTKWCEMVDESYMTENTTRDTVLLQRFLKSQLN